MTTLRFYASEGALSPPASVNSRACRLHAGQGRARYRPARFTISATVLAMMTSDSLLQMYDAQMRTDAEVFDAASVTRIGPTYAALLTSTQRGLLTYASLEGVSDIDALINEVIAHYRQVGSVRSFEWKARGHDEPADLCERLEAHGFTRDDVETVMVGDAEVILDAESALPEGYRVQRLTSREDVYAANELAARVFNFSDERRAEYAERQTRRLWGNNTAELWCVRTSIDPLTPDQMVCTGRIEHIPGTDFSSLMGGTCLPEHRGLGLYRALTAARARSALAAGKRYLHADCTEYSRPILQRAGLQAVTTAIPMIYSFPAIKAAI
ncbi:GNAT family N-acetyltransferase [Schaalia sp. Marseille-Q2122]|uniref:GNAT family N-acetyltransferase n=1 Tax=Schaalia sp. Marseille-Q2122 TaxID=2736604 RepID=UPI0015892E7C|nr:GNAT family N-acetyltransferase [Schaalia sp. Marseille-Q2122]